MKSPGTLLYVESPTASARLYGALLGREPVESSPSFAMFKLDGDGVLGLWARHDVKPGATAPGGAELCFQVDGEEAVRAAHADLTARGLRIVQAPVELDFGYTFTALDPDGHRLRVFAPGQP
jgi:catechol 2,3-dioxygenase-like lactoylglutathione lyase family enzyme